MKKIVTFFLLALLLIAGAKEIEKEIYTNILYALFPYHPHIKVWVDEPKKAKIFQEIVGVSLTREPQYADIVFIYHDRTLQKEFLRHSKALLFVGSYSLLKKLQDRAVGGFFWQKGRPNIIFLKPNLKKYHIQLPDEFSNIIEDSL